MADKTPEQIAEERIEEARRTGATELNLAGCGLTTLPESIAEVPQLRDLYINGNDLSSLPDSIGQLSHLERLFVACNGLGALPDSIGRLSQLRVLHAPNNRLAALPDSIGRLSQLQVLDVSNNALRTLPESLLQVSELKELWLHENYALGFPPEILGPSFAQALVPGTKHAKPAAILNYYFRQQRETRRRLNEAKILIVGQGAVGKTSLVKRLVRDEFDEHERKTEGINIDTWRVPSERHQAQSDEQIRVNVWDFGGQEIMHATHQFFLTKRSLYIVVVDARKGENECNIHYWLKIVQSYGADSPVLIVTNKHEPPHHLDLNETRLTHDYSPNVKGFSRVSCKTGDGIPGLRAAIEKQINNLPHVFDELPESYFTVKGKLEERAREEDYIDIKDYRTLCREHDLDEETDQNTLIRFLHDLGNVLNFDDPNDPYELRDTNILNPEWVTGGVYKILNNNALMQGRGVLEVGQLSTILDDPESYPKGRHQFIVDMMRKFELCFDFPESRGQRLLIPELLSPNEPDLGWNVQEALNFEYHYKVLPVGIISRFIVRMHHSLTDKPTYWRSGVLLDIDGARALVRGDSDAGRVYISVLGQRERRRPALTAIRNTFKAIHATIPKLGALEKVPLPGSPSVAVDYLHLLKLQKRGIDTFLPEGADEEYSVQELLNGVADRRERDEERDRLRTAGGERTKAITPIALEEPKSEVIQHPKVDTKTFVIAGAFMLCAPVILVAVLAVASNFVQSDWARVVILIAIILFTAIFFVFVALFTGKFGEDTAERVLTKILDKLGLLKPGRSSNPDSDDES